LPELTTSLLESIIPGLIAKYGKDMPMAVDIKTHDFPRAIFNPTDLGANVSIDMTFEVMG